MKKMYRLCATILVVVLASLMTTSVFAVAIPQLNNGVSEEIRERAYMELETVSPAMQEEILAARREVIYNTDWVADGYTGYIQDVETGEIIRTLPQFSEVFPGWELPVEEVALVDETHTRTIIEEDSAEILPLDIGAGTDDWLRLSSVRHYLESASASENADPFAAFTVDPYEMGTQIRSYATSLSSSETCNIGISDYYTGESLALGTRLVENQAVSVYVGVDEPTVAVRASTYSSPGWATMAIDGCYRVNDVR